MVSRVFVSIYTSIQSVPFESILLVTEDYLNIMQSGKQLLSQMKRQTSNQPTKSIKLWCIKRSQQKNFKNVLINQKFIQVVLI